DPCCSVIRRGLRIVSGFYFVKNLLFFFGIYSFSFFGHGSGLYLGEYFCCLGATHHREFGTWPGYYKPWIIGLSTHRVITCSIRIAYNNSKFWHYRITYRTYHFSSIFYYTAMLALASHHKSRNILKKYKGD